MCSASQRVNVDRTGCDERPLNLIDDLPKELRITFKTGGHSIVKIAFENNKGNDNEVVVPYKVSN